MKTFLNLQALSLPKEFTFLLRTSMANDQEVVEKVETAFKQNPVLQTVVGNSFSFSGNDNEVGKWVRTFGWLHFRDRLSSIYMNKIQNGFYPHEVDSSLINEILELEHELSPFTVQGVSRSYLLGFYLSLHNREHPDKPLKIPASVFEMLRLKAMKVERIDYLVLLLWQLHSFLGNERLERVLLHEKRDYDSLFAILTQEARERLSRNFLRYGFSINETDYFEKRIG